MGWTCLILTILFVSNSGYNTPANATQQDEVSSDTHSSSDGISTTGTSSSVDTSSHSDVSSSSETTPSSEFDVTSPIDTSSSSDSSSSLGTSLSRNTNSPSDTSLSSDTNSASDTSVSSDTNSPSDASLSSDTNSSSDNSLSSDTNSSSDNSLSSDTNSSSDTSLSSDTNLPSETSSPIDTSSAADISPPFTDTSFSSDTSDTSKTSMNISYSTHTSNTSTDTSYSTYASTATDESKSTDATTFSYARLPGETSGSENGSANDTSLAHDATAEGTTQQNESTLPSDTLLSSSTSRPLTENKFTNMTNPRTVQIQATDPEFYIIDVSACTPNTIYELHRTTWSVGAVQYPNVGFATCKWEIRVHPDYALKLTIKDVVTKTDADTFTLKVAEDVSISNRQELCVGCNTNKSMRGVSVLSRSSALLFDYESSDITAFIFVYLQFDVVLSILPMNYTLPNISGFLWSPGFDGYSKYGSNLALSRTISLPEHHIILISFSTFDVGYGDPPCYYGKLALYGTNGIIWERCGTRGFPLEIHRQSIRFEFYTDEIVSGLGFKLFFSILPESQEPKKLHGDLYNCSTEHYSSFEEHFRCNLITECASGEDEENCPYQTDECPGLIDAGPKCYSMSLVTNYDWSDAFWECKNRGMHLVAPRTSKEVEVLEHVRTIRQTSEIFIGLRSSSAHTAAVPGLYRNVWRWSDETMAYYRYYDIYGSDACVHYAPSAYFSQTPCDEKHDIVFLICEQDKHTVPQTSEYGDLRLSSVTTNFNQFQNLSLVECPKDGHVTHNFLSCDSRAKCTEDAFLSECTVTNYGTVPMFTCNNKLQTVHYSLVCDHRLHCADGSDEEFCVFPKCEGMPCRNKQCVSEADWCDGMQHCVDASDEMCTYSGSWHQMASVGPPAIVSFDGRGNFEVTAMKTSDQCPETHFQCPDGLCLPVYVRCNGVDDCQGREDEADCDVYQCPGFYRCRDSTVCLHLDHLCDGLFQCPQQDDELYCNIPCPEGCVCQGLAFVCTKFFPVNHTKYENLRYLNAGGSGMKTKDFLNNVFLVGLSLSRCGLHSVASMTNPNLQTLDLSNNSLTAVNMNSFLGLKNLRVLILSGNRLHNIGNAETVRSHDSLHTIDLSLTSLEIYDERMLSNTPHLRSLNFSHGALTTITKSGFSSTPELEMLDLRGSRVRHYPFLLLQDLRYLKTLYTDDYRLCCQDTLPEHFDMENCHTQKNEIASCEDLLRSDVYRVSLWIFAALALIGNTGSFVFRFYLQKKSATPQTSFDLFVTNLSVADFLMGVYLAVIGVADQVYRGNYVRYDEDWRTSPACEFAGFLSLVSSEVSAFNICLITVDRFLVLRFPFSRVRFRNWSTAVACGITWVVGILLAAIPLLPMTSHWEFYSQNGICIPLPVTRHSFHGHGYSFGVMIVLNFVLFLFIAVGQVFIYWSVKTNSVATTKKNSSRDATIARRLTTIVLSDFLCWFPIGLLGLLASTGTPISSEVNVGIAIFVLPFNSALNPFLYTLNIIWEKRRKASESRIMTRLKNQYVTERSFTDSREHNYQDLQPTKDSFLSYMDRCLAQRVFTRDDIAIHLRLQQTAELSGN